jgi:hypothetical protein
MYWTYIEWISIQGFIQKGDPKAAPIFVVVNLYFLRRINFTATATTPPIASSGRMLGSGMSTAQAAAGSINKSAVNSFCDFIAYSIFFRGHGFSSNKARFAPVITRAL